VAEELLEETFQEAAEPADIDLQFKENLLAEVHQQNHYLKEQQQHHIQ
jgi:hypothetical protein